MKKITVLLADDHQLIRETWAFMLNTDSRFEAVGAAASGEEVVEMAKTLRPDVVLMDINMGVMSGFDATKLVKKYSPGTKIIGVSMHSMPAYAKRMIREGASGYVSKNSPREEFLKAITEVYSGKNYICEEVKNILTQQEMEETTGKPDINSLSKRELEIVGYIKNGLSSKEISGQIGVTLKTVEVHRYNILKKLTLPNSAALVNFVNHAGF